MQIISKNWEVLSRQNKIDNSSFPIWLRISPIIPPCQELPIFQKLVWTFNYRYHIVRALHLRLTCKIMKVFHSNVVQPWTKCWTLMWDPLYKGCVLVWWNYQCSLDRTNILFIQWWNESKNKTNSIDNMVWNGASWWYSVLSISTSRERRANDSREFCWRRESSCRSLFWWIIENWALYLCWSAADTGTQENSRIRGRKLTIVPLKFFRVGLFSKNQLLSASEATELCSCSLNRLYMTRSGLYLVWDPTTL